MNTNQKRMGMLVGLAGVILTILTLLRNVKLLILLDFADCDVL